MTKSLVTAMVSSLLEIEDRCQTRPLTNTLKTSFVLTVEYEATKQLSRPGLDDGSQSITQQCDK